jgi:N-acylneuraminate cytidylyltransferase
MTDGEPPQKLARTSLPKIDRARIYAMVPARSGSKGVKGKNIKDFCGKPLMAWAIENGLKSKYITRTFVSTDSEDYRKIALEHGAEAPFLRPAEISHDTATDFQLFEHFIGWMKENEPERQPSLLVQLRATAPCTTVDMVDACIEKFLNHEDEGYDSLRTVTPADHEPFNMYFMDVETPDRLVPLIPTSHHKDDPKHFIPEPQSVARQILPKIYWHNAYIDILRPETVTEQKCCMGKRCLSYLMNPDDTQDIDNAEQWAAAETKKRKLLGL